MRRGAAGARRAARIRACIAARAHASRHPVRPGRAARQVVRAARGGVARARRHGTGQHKHAVYLERTGELRRVPDDDDAVARNVRREQVRARGGAGDLPRPRCQGHRFEPCRGRIRHAAEHAAAAPAGAVLRQHARRVHSVVPVPGVWTGAVYKLTPGRFHRGYTRSAHAQDDPFGVRRGGRAG